MSRTLKIEFPCKRELNFHDFPVSAFSRDFWLHLERPGRLLGSTWSFLGASWPQLGRSWDLLGANLGAFDPNLGATKGDLGLSLVTPKRTLASKRDDFEAYEALFWNLW